MSMPIVEPAGERVCISRAESLTTGFALAAFTTMRAFRGSSWYARFAKVKNAGLSVPSSVMRPLCQGSPWSSWRTNQMNIGTYG